MPATERIVIYVTADEKQRLYDAAEKKKVTASAFLKSGGLASAARILVEKAK